MQINSFNSQGHLQMIVQENHTCNENY